MLKSNAELSDYQKRIENIDTVILCVAEAERMVDEIGTSLASDCEPSRKPACDCPKRLKFSWGPSRTGP
jgi:hypothetical protein